jgi:hypothetical protein
MCTQLMVCTQQPGINGHAHHRGPVPGGGEGKTAAVNAVVMVVVVVVVVT